MPNGHCSRRGVFLRDCSDETVPEDLFPLLEGDPVFVRVSSTFELLLGMQNC